MSGWGGGRALVGGGGQGGGGVGKVRSMRDVYKTSNLHSYFSAVGYSLKIPPLFCIGPKTYFNFKTARARTLTKTVYVPFAACNDKQNAYEQSLLLFNWA